MMAERKNTQTGYPSVDKPWLKYYSEENINAALPNCSIYEYMMQNNKDFTSDIAIIYLGRKITYKELFENINRTASAFLRAGVKDKEIVTVALPSIPEALYCVYALNKIGAVANMIHPLAGKSETIKYINEVGSKIAVILDAAYNTIVEDIEKTSLQKVIIASPADSLPITLKAIYSLKVKKTSIKSKLFQSWKCFINDDIILDNSVKKDNHEMAIISHTGGTTGDPKGVMCSDSNINALIWQIGCHLPHERQEKYLVVLPPFINYSLVNSMLEPLAFGFQVILIPKYEPEKFAKYIKKYKPNHISSIPSYWEALLRIKEINKTDLSCLNHIYYGGEAMNTETEDTINKLILSRGARNKLCKGLGSTEMTSAATVTYEDSNLTGSVGIPLVKVNCKTVDVETGEELQYNEEGELCFAGDTLMVGYYNNQEATDDVIHIHSDGIRWFHTGDLGYINSDGVVFVTGRIKRIIITRGNDGIATKMFPDRIEKVLNRHPSVRACCVIGVKDVERINYPKAVIELNDAYTPSTELSLSLKDFCKEYLPSYLIPEIVEFTDSLPRTERGKIDYRALEMIK